MSLQQSPSRQPISLLSQISLDPPDDRLSSGVGLPPRNAAQPIVNTYIFLIKKRPPGANIKFAKGRDKYDKQLTNALI